MTEKEKISIITEEESMLERMKNYHINTNVCFNNISRIKTNAFFFSLSFLPRVVEFSSYFYSISVWTRNIYRYSD